MRRASHSLIDDGGKRIDAAKAADVSLCLPKAREPARITGADHLLLDDARARHAMAIALLEGRGFFHRFQHAIGGKRARC
jgi:hypothetical protein